jgi:hypothetical protein
VAVQQRINQSGWGKLSDMEDSVLRIVPRHPLAICCIIGFFSGALLDVDHLGSWLFHVQYPVLITFYGSGALGQGRNLHGIALVGGGFMCTYAGGFVLLMVLEEIADKVTVSLRRAFAVLNRY